VPTGGPFLAARPFAPARVVAPPPPSIHEPPFPSIHCIPSSPPPLPACHAPSLAGRVSSRGKSTMAWTSLLLFGHPKKGDARVEELDAGAEEGVSLCSTSISSPPARRATTPAPRRHRCNSLKAPPRHRHYCSQSQSPCTATSPRSRPPRHQRCSLRLAPCRSRGQGHGGARRGRGDETTGRGGQSLPAPPHGRFHGFPNPCQSSSLRCQHLFFPFLHHHGNQID
jgi:hypothetical protein